MHSSSCVYFVFCFPMWHKRVGMLEMTNHEFLDKNRRKERTTFADGTAVTVDWDRGTVTIAPDLAAPTQ
jgi:hypothetical protein